MPLMVFLYEYYVLQLSWVGEPSKKSSLQRLIDFNRPNVVLLQETLGLNEEVSCILETLLPGLQFVAVDVRDRSSGLALGWNLKSCRCDGVWSFSSGIGVDIFDAHLGKVLTILNIYGPFVKRVPYWNSLLKKDFVTNREVILGGDFYLSLRCVEVWGPKEISDTLASFFLIPFPIMICWILLL